jgi:hypothetical protein
MSFLVSIEKDGDRFVEVRCNNTGTSVAGQKIIDASTLAYSSGIDTELLDLCGIFLSADNSQKTGIEIYWADSSGAQSANPAVIIEHSLGGSANLYIKNDYPNSNGDVWIHSHNSIFTLILRFKKVRGFYSSKAKPWAYLDLLQLISTLHHFGAEFFNSNETILIPPGFFTLTSFFSTGICSKTPAE